MSIGPPPEAIQGITDALADIRTPARMVTAITQFRGGPGREREAAEAWGFELKYYFLRGIGDQPPEVIWEAGIYTCTGTMRTTHPSDRDSTRFDWQEPWDLGFCTSADRRNSLRQLYPRREYRFDGESE